MTVPADFPRVASVATLTGAQPKIAVRLDHATGRYFTGQTDEELKERHDICEDLAIQLVAKCRKNREVKYAAFTEVEILERLLAQLLGTNWGSDDEMRWVIRRTATLLAWPSPASAAVSDGVNGC